MFARLIWPSARSELVPRFQRQILTNLRRTTVSPGDFLSPGLPPPPAISFFSASFHTPPVPGTELRHVLYTCMHQRIVGQDIHARRIHVSTAGREKANRAYVRSRLLRHRIRKCSSFEHGGKTIDLASHSYGGNLFRNTNSFVFV